MDQIRAQLAENTNTWPQHGDDNMDHPLVHQRTGMPSFTMLFKHPYHLLVLWIYNVHIVFIFHV